MHLLNLILSYITMGQHLTWMDLFLPVPRQVDSNQGLRKCGRMYLVDLAGSETVSKTNASGQTLQVKPS